MVKLGSAHGDENGKAHGGKAGDQTGKEVSIENYYKHKKGWRVLRTNDENAREKIAVAMERACANNNIGYDQWQRDTLLNQVKTKGFDPAKADKPCETDCSALVRVCCAYAFGRDIVTGDARFSTANMCKILVSTGLFTELTGAEYTDKSDNLRRGDILCTKTQGHTVVVLNDGDKVGNDEPTLKKGDSGSLVTELQTLLIEAGYSLPKYGADGSFGEETLKAIKAFQGASGLVVDGIVGKKTWAALRGAQELKTVLVTGGSVNVRSGAGTMFKVLFVAHKGDELRYISTAVNGWYKVERNGVECYISNKYSELK